MATKKFIIEVEEGKVRDCYNCPFNNLNCDKYDLLDCDELNLATMKIKEYEENTRDTSAINRD